MEHAKHIIRAVLLLVIAATLFVLARHFAIPQSFGVYGAYRAASVTEHAAKEPQHGAAGSCAGCHDEQADVKAEGKHANLSCESCHAPLAVHVRDDQKVGPMTIPTPIEVCSWCHQKLRARPEAFPQVVFASHVAEHDETMTDSVCLECHNAHNPSE